MCPTAAAVASLVRARKEEVEENGNTSCIGPPSVLICLSRKDNSDEVMPSEMFTGVQ